MKNIFITGISSDIGMYLAESFFEEGGCCVNGTYRKMAPDKKTLLKKCRENYIIATFL